MSNTCDIIFRQLGGGRFASMTGAKRMVDIGNGLQFDLPRGFARHGINKVRITLTPMDLYRVEFLKWNARKLEAETIIEHDGLFAEDLRSTFTEATGLDCSL